MFGLISAGISLIGSACSAVGGFLSSVGGALASAGSMVLNALQVGLPIFARVCEIVLDVAKVLNVLNPQDTDKEVLDLGMRAELADQQGIRSEQFQDYQAYIQHLRQEIKVEKLELDKLTDVDRLKYGAIGTSVTIRAIQDKYTTPIPNDFWLSAAKMELPHNEVKSLLDRFESQGVSADLAGFQERRLSSLDNEKVYRVLEGHLQENHPQQLLGEVMALGKFPSSQGN